MFDPDMRRLMRDLTGSMVSMLSPLVVERGDTTLTLTSTASLGGPGVKTGVAPSPAGVSPVNTTDDDDSIIGQMFFARAERRLMRIEYPYLL